MSNDDEFGLPLILARWYLLPCEITTPAILAWNHRRAFTHPDFVSRNPWHYEVLTYPETAPAREPWSSWQNQLDDPLVAAEAARQGTWLRASLELGNRLSDGRLQGLARQGNIAGPWITIPAKAWCLLRVPFDVTFENWRVGRATGGGLDLWDIRVIDNEGLPLDQALIAYGPAETASTLFQARAAASVIATPDELHDTAPMTRLARRMAEIYVEPDAPNVAALELKMQSYLLSKMQSGELVGYSLESMEKVQEIPADAWKRGEVSIPDSTLTTAAAKFTGVLVRQRGENGSLSARSPTTKPSNDEVLSLLIDHFKSVGKPYPKQDDILNTWRHSVNATADQARKAFRSLPTDMKRRVGHKG